MNTITINSAAYQGAEMYAKLHHISVEAVFEKGIDLLLGKLRSHQMTEKNTEYYISPKVKALESGFKCPELLSSNYKQELSDALVDKYL